MTDPETNACKRAVGTIPSYISTGCVPAQTDTHANSFEFPLQMQHLIERNREGALVELDLAIGVAEVALRDAITREAQEYSQLWVDTLKEQREVETRHVRIGRPQFRSAE
jgi:hypothetical protein